MAAFVANKPLDSETTNLTANILTLDTGPHSFTFRNYKQVMTIINGDVGAVTVNFLGDGVTSAQCPGIGIIDLSAGKDIVVASGDTVTVNIPRIGEYMGADGNNVAVTISGATVLSTAYIEEF